MGMAATQARLLALTSRISDVELRAQQIQNQKLALATQKDEVYERYNAALDATKIRVAFNNGDGSRSFVNATFNAVCTFNPARFRQYALQDNRSGLAIVADDVKDVYDNYGGDKYTFAWKMLGFDHFNWLGEGPNDTVNEFNSTDVTGHCVGYGRNTNTQEDFDYEDSPFKEYADGNMLAMTPAEYKVFMEHGSETLVEMFNKWREAVDNGAPISEKKELLNTFRERLYSDCGEQLFEMMNRNKQDNNHDQINYNTDKDWKTDCYEEFNYYVELWEFIEQSGGCTTIDAQYKDGEDGEKWFNNMVESGLVSIHEFTTEKGWKETSVATSTNGNYLREESDDTDLKKAEIAYEREMSTINAKDKKFDTQLSKLETEREALKKEMESYKSVRKDNIDKNFGIFS